MISLKPTEEQLFGNKPTPSFYKALAIFIIGLILIVVLIFFINNAKDSSNLELQKAVNEQSSIDLQIRETTKQIGVQQGGLNRLALVSDVLESRYDWARIIARIGNRAPGELYIASLNGSASATSSNVGSNTVTLNGTASSSAQVEKFIANLRKNTADFEIVEPTEVTRNDESGFSYSVNISLNPKSTTLAPSNSNDQNLDENGGNNGS